MGDSLTSTGIEISPIQFKFSSSSTLKRNTEFINAQNSQQSYNLQDGIYLGSTFPTGWVGLLWALTATSH